MTIELPYRKRVEVVIIKDYEVLICTHHKHGRTWQCLPGGGIDNGESIEEAAIKECLEEVGILVSEVIIPAGLSIQYDYNEEELLKGKKHNRELEFKGSDTRIVIAKFENPDQTKLYNQYLETYRNKIKAEPSYVERTEAFFCVISNNTWNRPYWVQ